jgi:hypothetical protein
VSEPNYLFADRGSGRPRPGVCVQLYDLIVWDSYRLRKLPRSSMKVEKTPGRRRPDGRIHVGSTQRSSRKRSSVKDSPHLRRYRSRSFSLRIPFSTAFLLQYVCNSPNSFFNRSRFAVKSASWITWLRVFLSVRACFCSSRASSSGREIVFLIARSAINHMVRTSGLATQRYVRFRVNSRLFCYIQRSPLSLSQSPFTDS